MDSVRPDKKLKVWRVLEDKRIGMEKGKRKIAIGSRDSVLAMEQTKLLEDYIRENCPGICAEVLAMKTTGDRILEKRLEEIGGKGLFVKELDRALLENRTQLSVHSLKDMPMETDEELPILGFSRREDPRDVLVLPEGSRALNKALPVGTSSLRRELQFKRLYPEMEVKMVRGNLISRLKKLERGEYGGLLLAAAGLKRIGLTHRIFRYFSCEEMLPAAGQGILAVQGRKDLDYDFLEGFFDEDARDAALAERSFVRGLGGSCFSPTAAYAVCEGEKLTLTGLYYPGGNRDGDSGLRREARGPACEIPPDAKWGESVLDTVCGDRTEAEKLGRALAERMLGSGG